MICSASLTQCSSCDRGFMGPDKSAESSGALVKTVPEALTPCGHHAHPRIAEGGMLRCIQLHAQRGGKQIALRRKKGSHKESRRKGAHSYPSIHMPGDNERKFKVQIHLLSTRVAGESTAAHPCVMQDRRSTLASRYTGTHAHLIHTDRRMPVGKTSYFGALTWDPLCPVAEQVAHLLQQQSLNLIRIQNIWQTRVWTFNRLLKCFDDSMLLEIPLNDQVSFL